MNKCTECNGELEPTDKKNSHSNPRTCIRILREKLDWYISELNEVSESRNWCGEECES